MKIKNDSIIYPIPTPNVIEKRERQWHLKLPEEYIDFIAQYNGGIPEENEFLCNSHKYLIIRFLCMLENINTEYGCYDISVVESQIGERLTGNEDLIGIEILPIAELFSGDYVCLDFRNNKINPSVCIWDHEKSENFSPVTYLVSNSFMEFKNMIM